MHHFQKWPRLLRAVLGIAATCEILIASAPPGSAQTAITNLSQLRQATAGERALVGNVKLSATVFACDTNSGALVLSDATGADLLEMDGLAGDFQPGDTVRIESSRCFVRPGDIGLSISAAPLVNNDGVHGPRTNSAARWLAAGRYPVRLDWFNLYYWSALGVSCNTSNSAERLAGDATTPPPSIQASTAECFEGNWSRLPNFQLLLPVKTGAVTNFDMAFRTRTEMVGIRFNGYFDAPESGLYHFSVESDDGSLLWVGDPRVPVQKTGSEPAPTAPRAGVGEPMRGLDEHRLVTLEGRVNFAFPVGKGLRFELRSEPDSVSVALADSGPLSSKDLLNAYVRVSGVASGVLIGDQRVLLGKLSAANWKQVTILENAPGKGNPGPVLTTILQVHSLSASDAARAVPVKIRGVVTALGLGAGRWVTIQDDTRGGFVRIAEIPNRQPNIGEFWEIQGHTQPGDFAPIIIGEEATLLGRGRLPEPAHPTWNELANGSHDVQWCELQGLVTEVQSNSLSLLLPEGRQEVRMDGWGESELKRFNKSVVRIRGTLFAVWDAATHEVRVGNIAMRNASVTVDKPAPDDPFDAPEKTPRGLFLFDAKATPFQRVKVRGQVTYVDANCVFIENGGGLEVLPAEGVKINTGDMAEAVGYPELSGPSPLLREALLRKTGDGTLPKAPVVGDANLERERLASTRICVEGMLAGQHREEGVWVLQMQSRTHLFFARVAHPADLGWLRHGSKLALTGIYSISGPDASHFELLVNSPADVAVISQPSWWTLERLLSAVGVLLITLALAAIWITQLRRQVGQRTLQLQHEIRERERAERQHALEAERSRIARDLHDDLGSSLTEINVLASTGQRPGAQDGGHPALFKAIARKARSLIEALDVIVWAVDPEDNSLQSLADYLSGYTREFLANSEIASRFKIPVTLPDATLDGEVRHELLMIVKETLNNIVRHADATEVEFQLHVTGQTLEIRIEDNGKGFDSSADPSGHGLRNRAARLQKIGGSCEIESRSGVGTIVLVRLPLPDATRAAADVLV